MLGKWSDWYAGLDEPAAYGDTTTYERGARWLADLAIEDWGCGKGWMSTLIDPALYRGVDGSRTPFASVVADLRTYRSTTPGLFMRHVLEHNRDWSAILDNATASATERLFIAVFTPLVDETTQVGWTDGLNVPDIAFALPDLVRPITAAGFSCSTTTLSTITQYGTETVLECER